MQIQNTLSHVNSFFDLLPIVKEAKAELSFFGAQYVSVTGYEGTLEIDALAAKVIDLVKKNPQFSEEDRSAGKEISALINRNVYQLIEDKANRSNCFTWLFVWLRQLPELISMIWKGTICYPECTARWEWKDCESWNMAGYHEIFDFYTLEQFQEKYRFSPADAKKQGYSIIGEFHDPRRWKITESDPTNIRIVFV